jgi:hypothetical protein
MRDTQVLKFHMFLNIHNRRISLPNLRHMPHTRTTLCSHHLIYMKECRILARLLHMLGPLQSGMKTVDGMMHLSYPLQSAAHRLRCLRSNRSLSRLLSRMSRQRQSGPPVELGSLPLPQLFRRLLHVVEAPRDARNQLLRVCRFIRPLQALEALYQVYPLALG